MKDRKSIQWCSVALAPILAKNGRVREPQLLAGFSPNLVFPQFDGILISKDKVRTIDWLPAEMYGSGTRHATLIEH